MIPLRVRGDLGAMAMKGYAAFPKTPALIKAPPLKCFVLYPENSLRESHPSTEIQSKYSAAPNDRATERERERERDSSRCSVMTVTKTMLFSHTQEIKNHEY